ncbi:MAG: hypothetical protein Q8936_02580 [Bacillota bacterium]|nr:hypothetical protein [Bacillota bacterium]
MVKSHIKLIQSRLVIIFCIITVIIIGILVFYYSSKINISNNAKTIVEIGDVPVWVKRNNKTYNVTDKSVNSVDKHLGRTQSTSLDADQSLVEREVYSIPNVDPDKAITIKQLSNTYIRAEISK